MNNFLFNVLLVYMILAITFFGVSVISSNDHNGGVTWILGLLASISGPYAIASFVWSTNMRMNELEKRLNEQRSKQLPISNKER